MINERLEIKSDTREVWILMVASQDRYFLHVGLFFILRRKQGPWNNQEDKTRQTH